MAAPGGQSLEPVRRSTSDSFSAAAMTAGAYRRPGWRVSLSMGPDTETEAITLPLGERTGAEATQLTLGHCLSPAALADRCQSHRREFAFASPRWRFRILPGEQDLSGRPCAHGELCATGVVSRRPDGRCSGSHARRLAGEELGGLARDVCGAREWTCGGQQASSPAAAASSIIRGPSTKRPY